MWGKFLSADNIRIAVFLITLIGAMWTLTSRLEDRLTQRIDRLEDKMEMKFDKIDARLDSFGERIARNEARLNDKE